MVAKHLHRRGTAQSALGCYVSVTPLSVSLCLSVSMFLVSSCSAHTPWLFSCSYFDCSCGQPPGDAFSNPEAVSRFAADAQAAFDRALAMIAAAGKWASAWNSEGSGTSADPVWKGLTRENCQISMDSWMKIGAQAHLSLQALAVPFFAKGHNPFKPPGPPPPPPPPQPLPGCRDFAVKDNFCAHPEGTPMLLTRLHTSQITCCRECMARTDCDSWILDSRNASVCACMLFAGQVSHLGTVATGCTTGWSGNRTLAKILPSQPSPPPPQPFFSQNNTLAGFIIARGIGGGLLELPVCGAFESMADYDLSNPLLRVDLGTPLGPGRQNQNGEFSREFSKATVSLSCTTWTSSFKLKPR
jgi:hypothetical protein